ncbi:16943_t:CDS:10, partial [Entrophospora sp. SA101]
CVFATEVISLASSNFTESISEGTWFIKFFVPWCPHCQKLAPTWTKVWEENESYLISKNLHMAKVDCTLDGDLCNKNDVKGYPTLHVFNQGKFVETYDSLRDFDSLTSFVKKMAQEYYILSDDQDDDSVLSDSNNNESAIKPNPLGQVVTLNGKNFDKLISSGTWFIKYYAPWCGHCQKLAPTWEELGRKLQNKMNIGKVDCTTNGVKGYPTLKLYPFNFPKKNQNILITFNAVNIQGPDDVTDYKGSRELISLQDFAESAAKARIFEINLKDFERAKKMDDVLFLFLYNETTPVKPIVKELSRSFFTVKFYSSSDSNLIAQLDVDSLPSLLVIKDDFKKIYPNNSIEAYTDRQSLKAWIQSEKYPLVPAMDFENYEDILGGERLVVLGVLRPLDGKTFIKTKNDLKDIAKLYYKQIKQKGGSEDGRAVIFAWIDGKRWSDYIYGVYGLTNNDLPTILIADPVTNEFFDTTRTGEKISLADQEKLLASIHDAKTGYLAGKSTIGFDIFSLGAIIQNSVIKHPFITLIIFLLAAGGVYRYCFKPQIREVKDFERGYEKFE